MSNFNIKLDLSKVKGAFVSDIKGKTATKKCLCLPIEESNLYQGNKGIYISLSAFEMQEARYNDTHFIKQSISKEEYEKLTDEERKATAILGGMRPVQSVKQIIKQQTIETEDNTDDLPF